ncbi:hypothetical protein ANN_17830 [Periplaneta americana]|uniref:Uncharacterized protein n=1 Tax=Periplaneta americana TaxID=6978 RepID=A0ABQ8SW75_PERAM|nr:hypothetical protein ANN_17830 [Periplaneta americana]
MEEAIDAVLKRSSLKFGINGILSLCQSLSLFLLPRESTINEVCGGIYGYCSSSFHIAQIFRYHFIISAPRYALKCTVYVEAPGLESARLLLRVQFKVCHGSLYVVIWLADEPREFNLPTLPQRRITYVPEKLPTRAKGHFAKMYEDKLKVNGKWYDLEFCLRNEDHPEFGLTRRTKDDKVDVCYMSEGKEQKKIIPTSRTEQVIVADHMVTGANSSEFRNPHADVRGSVEVMTHREDKCNVIKQRKQIPSLHTMAVRLLTGWKKGTHRMPFAIPMIRREPKDYLSDCHLFCLTNITGITSKTKYTVKYPNLKSAIRPVLHNEQFPVPVYADTTLGNNSDSDLTETENVSDENKNDPTFEANTCSSEPYFPNQKDLNDLIRDLNLSKQQAEGLASRLKGWNLLQKDVRICSYRGHHSDFKDCFSEENGIVFCNDICSVMETLGLQHRPDEWRLFIDSSKVSLKAVLLHIGNELASIPVAHAADMKETYQNMKVILEKIQYGKYEWYICAMGCNMSLKTHFLDSHLDFFPENLGAVSDEHEVVSGISKLNLIQKYPLLSETNVKEGVFDCLQINQIIKDAAFINVYQERPRASDVKPFRYIINKFLDNNKDSQYEQTVITCSKIGNTLIYRCSGAHGYG